MKRSSLSAALAAILLLGAGCDKPPPTVDEYLGILPQVIEFAERDARQTQPGRPADGPLIMDIKSFAGGAYLIAKEKLDTARIARAIGKPYESATPNEALLCDESGLVGGCYVRGYGVLLYLNLARGASNWMNVIVTTTSTDRSAHPTRICDRVWRMNFEREDGVWKLKKTERGGRFTPGDPCNERM